MRTGMPNTLVSQLPHTNSVSALTFELGFAWYSTVVQSVAHRFVLNPGAPTGCTDNTLGSSDVVSPYVAITKGFCFERSLIPTHLQSENPKPPNMFQKHGDTLYYSLIPAIWERRNLCVLLMQRVGNHSKFHSGPFMNKPGLYVDGYSLAIDIWVKGIYPLSLVSTLLWKSSLLKEWWVPCLAQSNSCQYR